MRILTTEAEGRRCFDHFVGVCTETADQIADHKASFRPNSVTKPTFFYLNEDIWIMPTDGSGHSKSRTRYWNCFGIGGQPPTASTRITIEVNHPHRGRNRRLTGRFIVDGNTYLLAHTGRLGGGRKDGASQNFINSKLSDNFEKVNVEGEQLFLVARLIPDSDFARSVGRFVWSMAAARNGATSDVH